MLNKLKKLLSRLISVDIALGGNGDDELPIPSFILEILPNDPDISNELGWFSYSSFSNETTECFGREDAWTQIDWLGFDLNMYSKTRFTTDNKVEKGITLCGNGIHFQKVWV